MKKQPDLSPRPSRTSQALGVHISAGVCRALILRDSRAPRSAPAGRADGRPGEHGQTLGSSSVYSPAGRRRKAANENLLDTNGEDPHRPLPGFPLPRATLSGTNTLRSRGVRRQVPSGTGPPGRRPRAGWERPVQSLWEILHVQTLPVRNPPPFLKAL